ncbi:MAG: hypothetical protein LBS57_04420 [Treponema sp.]|nr:hypothetical protein [Treponema sp.]
MGRIFARFALNLALASSCLLGLAGCGYDLTDSRYSLELPEIPAAWVSLPGPPQWRVEWLNPEGLKERALIGSGEKPEIRLPRTWTSAVIAWPCWPEQGIVPGVFRPAGALFPFDVSGLGRAGGSGGSLVLGWRGGVDAFLYWELAAAADSGAGETPEGTATARLPENFNWPRFRELFNDENVNKEVRGDPWLADWRGIAQKIVQSGFDKRRLVPRARSEMRIPLPPGLWVGTSPFAAPLSFEDTAAVFPVCEAVDTWVSEAGILRCSREAWIFLPWE